LVQIAKWFVRAVGRESFGVFLAAASAQRRAEKSREEQIRAEKSGDEL
jgi:hypothetical protein